MVRRLSYNLFACLLFTAVACVPCKHCQADESTRDNVRWSLVSDMGGGGRPVCVTPEFTIASLHRLLDLVDRDHAEVVAAKNQLSDMQWQFALAVADTPEPPKIKTIAQTGPLTLGTKPTVAALVVVPDAKPKIIDAKPCPVTNGICKCGCADGKPCTCGALSYKDAMAEASKSGRLIVVFVGCDSRKVAGCVSSKVDCGDTWGAKPCVLVGLPISGSGNQLLAADADDDAIVSAGRKLTPALVTTTAQQPQRFPIWNAVFNSGGCPNGNCGRR